MTKFFHLVVAGVVGCGLGWTIATLCTTLVAEPRGESTTQNVSVYPAYDVLLAFGDSLTQLSGDPGLDGYVSRLSHFYQRQMDVINRGFSGYNTSLARTVVDKVFPVTQPGTTQLTLGKRGEVIWPVRDNNIPGPPTKMQLCILFFGANDAVLPSSRLHNPIDSYAENLKYFIALLRDPSSKYYSPNTRIMIITPPAVSDAMTKESAKGQSVFKYVSRAATKQYADMAIVVAKEANIPFVDLNTAIDKKVEELVATIKDPGVYAGYDRFLADGLHLTARGYEVLYNLIIDTIRTNWPEIMPGPPLKATVLNPKVNQ